MAGVNRLVALDLHHLDGSGRGLELRRAGRQIRLQPAGGLLEICGHLRQHVGAHGGRGLALLQTGHPGPDGIDVVLLPGCRASHQLCSGARPGHGLFGVRRTTEETCPPLPQCFLVLGQSGIGSGQLVTFGRATGCLLGLGGNQLGREVCRLGLERRDHVDVGRGIEGGDDRPCALTQHARETSGPLDEPLHATQGVRQVLLPPRRQLGRGRGRLGIELRQRLLQFVLLLAAHAQALARRTTTRHEVRQLASGQVAAQGEQLRRHDVVRPGRRRLTLEGTDLAPDLTDEVAQPLEVLGRRGKPAVGAFPAAAMLEHPGRFLDDRPPVLRAGVEHGVELSLTDDHVLLAADARIAQQLLDVEQPARRSVDGVLAVARAEQRPGDGHLGQIDGQFPRGVVDGQ